MTLVIDWLSAPWELIFMRRAFAVAVMASVVCAVVGSFVVLRGMAFIGDAIVHAVFPGVAVAYVLAVNLALGGAIAGVITALLIAVFSQNRRLKEDAVIGVFFAFAFGLGIVLVSTQRAYTGDLASFLFGQILGISDGDVVTVAVVGAIVVGATLLLTRHLVTVSLDRETAAASGLPVFWLDMFLYVMVTLAIVISLQAVGNILVLALLITPAAAARMLTDRLSAMILLAAGIGAFSATLGLYLSFYLNLASGGLIVLVVTAVFLLCWTFAPQHGWVAKRRSRQRRAEKFPDAAIVTQP